MTEADWQTSADPQAMLAFVGDRSLLTDRRARLFAVACCRRVWHLLVHPEHREGVSLAERYADGAAGEDALARAHEIAMVALYGILSPREGDPVWAAKIDRTAAVNAADAATGSAAPGLKLESSSSPWESQFGVVHFAQAARAAAGASEGVAQAALIRCLFGNPFGTPTRIDPVWLRWNGDVVPKLARLIYDERHLPEGSLDAARLAVLADALEEAGCTDLDILGHLRQQGQAHVRGCWIVDLLLCKS
jgi:hypothetical protein